MTIKPFKSALAAKQAMTKAEKAWVEANHAARCCYGNCMENLDKVNMTAAEITAEQKRLNAVAVELSAKAQAIYAQAKAQGFYVSSWHFSDCNPTRDLIAANMD